jgi:sialidase-1
MKTIPNLFVAFSLFLVCADLLSADDLPITLSRGEWKTTESGIAMEGTSHLSYINSSIKTGDFHLKIKLKLDRLEGTAVSIVFDREHFGLDGKGRKLFTQSPGSQALMIGDATKYIKTGEFFRFEVIRASGVARYLIDGKEVYRREKWNSRVSRVAIRPWRNRVEVAHVELTGDVEDATKMNVAAGKPLFVSGRDGYNTYRIPALVKTVKGTLLAFCEGRVNSQSDHGDIDIVLRRSEDGGKTWGENVVVRDRGNHQVGNPCPLVDKKTGRIFLLCCESSSSESQVLKGTGVREVSIFHSDDDGLTWSQPQIITDMVKRDNWHWYATGPCSGIQIESGRHAGRLVVPANHSIHFEDPKQGWEYRSHSLFSDDGGATWEIGEESENGASESQIAEVAPDHLIQDIRMQRHGKRIRAYRRSQDGGETWGQLVHDSMRPDPICQGSIVSQSNSNNSERTLFSSNPTGPGRTNLTVYRSMTGGKTWDTLALLYHGPTAYSDLEVIGDKLCCLYEVGQVHPYEGIYFTYVEKD